MTFSELAPSPSRRPSQRSGAGFSARINRVLKDRLGHFARPEGRGEPFRARVFAEPAL